MLIDQLHQDTECLHRCALRLYQQPMLLRANMHYVWLLIAASGVTLLLGTTQLLLPLLKKKRNDEMQLQQPQE